MTKLRIVIALLFLFVGTGCATWKQPPSKPKTRTALTLIEKGQLQQIVATTRNVDKQTFFSKAIPIAIGLQEKYKIPVSSMVAMSLYESRFGTSKLSKEANNYFGIKAARWKGPVMHAMTRDGRRRHIQAFRRYNNMEESFEDYVVFLQNNPRYRRAFVALDGKQFVHKVLKAGYCPDRDYYRNIVKVMGNHNLLVFDTTVK